MRSEGKKRTLELSIIQGFSKIEKLFGGATSNRKRFDMALSLSKLYLCYDVSPLNKVFTALHCSTQVCILGTISEDKDTNLFELLFQKSNSFLYYIIIFFKKIINDHFN